jgi:hypothetical protein
MTSLYNQFTKVNQNQLFTEEGDRTKKGFPSNDRALYKSLQNNETQNIY